jgi:hypothetical protein
MKGLKIISCFFGERRNYNNNPTTKDKCLELLKLNLMKEEIVDPGMEMDVLLVNNENGYAPGNDYIFNLNGIRA